MFPHGCGALIHGARASITLSDFVLGVHLCNHIENAVLNMINRNLCSRNSDIQQAIKQYLVKKNIL